MGTKAEVGSQRSEAGSQQVYFRFVGVQTGTHFESMKMGPYGSPELTIHGEGLVELDAPARLELERDRKHLETSCLCSGLSLQMAVVLPGSVLGSWKAVELVQKTPDELEHGVHSPDVCRRQCENGGACGRTMCSGAVALEEPPKAAHKQVYLRWTGTRGAPVVGAPFGPLFMVAWNGQMKLDPRDARELNQESDHMENDFVYGLQLEMAEVTAGGEIGSWNVIAYRKQEPVSAAPSDATSAAVDVIAMMRQTLSDMLEMRGGCPLAALARSAVAVADDWMRRNAPAWPVSADADPGKRFAVAMTRYDTGEETFYFCVEDIDGDFGAFLIPAIDQAWKGSRSQADSIARLIRDTVQDDSVRVEEVANG